MGIYDREYIRRDQSGFFGTFTAGHGQVCKWLIIINVAVFVLQVITMDPPDAGPVTDGLMLDVQAVLHGQVWRLLTYAFLHDPKSLMHILFNMLFLWWFGPDLEDLYGSREFLTFYLVSAIAGGLAFVLSYQAEAFIHPNEAHVVLGRFCLGASGAVTAVLVLCACYYPNRTILLFFILPIPIWFFILFQLGPDAYQFLMALLHRQQTGNTAVAVHLGGAAFAFVYYKRRWRLLDFWSDLRSWQKQMSRPRLRVYREDKVATKLPSGGRSEAAIDDDMDARLDAVLDKVNRSGRNSLTEEELQLLLRASEIYRRRRT
jgi:membrane associated rhomboid family serine protease